MRREDGLPDGARAVVPAAAPGRKAPLSAPEPGKSVLLLRNRITPPREHRGI